MIRVALQAVNILVLESRDCMYNVLIFGEIISIWPFVASFRVIPSTRGSLILGSFQYIHYSQHHARV